MLVGRLAVGGGKGWDAIELVGAPRTEPVYSGGAALRDA
jgi:hypothetical protein